MAGKTTDTLPAAQGLYLPLRTSRVAVGVLGCRPSDPQRLVAPDQLHLLEAFANQIALAIEYGRSQGARGAVVAHRPTPENDAVPAGPNRRAGPSRPWRRNDSRRLATAWERPRR